MECSLTAHRKLTLVVDYGAMITVTTPERGVFNTKPLQVIWDRYSEYYCPKNTIMFDDLKRNFVMNPQNVRPTVRTFSSVKDLHPHPFYLRA